MLLPSAGSFQVFHADAKEKAEQAKEGILPSPTHPYPGGHTGLEPPAGATELPGPRRVIHLAEREQTAQVREEEESRKKGAHQPPRRNNSPFHAESSQIHWTPSQTGQPQMAWQGRYGFLPFCR